MKIQKKADAIALKLRNKEQGQVLREVNALNDKKAPLANTVPVSRFERVSGLRV